ncbi:MAG: ComEC/Rec2 family competence protein [Patescibacteria group bacterium]
MSGVAVFLFLQNSYNIIVAEKLTPAQILRRLLFGLLVGIAVGYFVFLSWQTAAIISILLLGMMFIIKDQRRWWLLALIFLTLGFAHSATEQPRPPSNIPYGEKVEFNAWISEAPLLEESRARYVVTVEAEAWQRVLISTRRHPVYNYGDRLQISCKLELQDFSYWQARDVYSSCSYPLITELAGQQGSIIRSQLYEFRNSLSQRVARLLPEPHLSLLVGIIWGEQSGLPFDLKESFRRTGTTHILAVSGYNVTTLTAILFTILIAIGFKRAWASLGLVILIISFVIFSGAEASVIRAGIMGGLVVLVRLVGRASKPHYLLLLAAGGMLAIWPRLLIDLGFQLSFAAMAGLMYLSPVIKYYLKWLPELMGLRQVVAETLSATAATLPLILLRIANISLVSPLANLLIVPVVPLVMIGGLLLLPLSLMGGIAVIAAWPVWLILSYVQTITLALGSLPWSYIEASVGVWLSASLVYIVLALVFQKAQSKSIKPLV